MITGRLHLWYRVRRGRARKIDMRLQRWLLVAAAALAPGCGKPALPHEGKSVAQLERMLQDADPVVQAQGALGLSEHGPAAKGAAPALAELLHSPHSVVRQNAALALGKIGPEAREAVPALTEALDDADWTVRRQAATALGEIGPDARDALPALDKRARDPDPLVRKAAQAAREKIRGH
jgi:HEAT repeat protein